MIKKCLGCGAQLQTDNIGEVGFTRNLEQDLCERCFRIRNYGDYQVVDKDNEAYLQILKEMNQTNDLVLFVIDLFNLNEEVFTLASKIKNPCILVFTKRDLFAS